jgi:hypothetical protein
MRLKVKRQCGDCTACCDGRMVLDIFGKRYSGRPCHYVGEKGCTIYKHRPNDPCRIFNCGWLRDKDFKYPEFLKPNKSGFILLDWKKTKTGIPFIIAIAGRDGYSNEALFWLLDYCSENNLNIEFMLQKTKHYIGSKEFRDYYKNKNGKLNI